VKAINAGEDGIFAFEYKENGKKMYIIFNVNNKDAALKGVDLTGYHKLLDSDGKVSLGQNTTLMPLSTLVVEGVNETPTTNIGNQGETQPVQIPSNVDANNSESSEDTISNVNTSTEVSADTIELTHNAYVYDSNGDVVKKTDGSNIDLTKGSSVKI
ncbi:SLAP domain-containing protein, partial [Lactobacillus helveticus]